MKFALRCFAWIVIASLMASMSYAQAYPSRPIKFVIQYPPGGVHDTLVRILQPRLAEGLGQPIVIDNRPGAGGNIAAEAVAKSAGDGYTILVASDTVVVAQHLYKSLGFDLFRDFVPITKLATFPMTLVAHPALPANTVGELVARAKALPGQINIASPGAGTLNHLVAEQFKAVAGIDLQHVPYKGAAPAMTDLIGGRVQCMFVTLAVAIPQARSRRLKILGLAAAARSSVAPNVPTFAESGYPGLEASIYSGLLAPAGTPAEAVQRLNQEAARALRTPEVQARLAELGGDATPMTPSEYLAFLHREYARWGTIIREHGIRVD